MYHVEQKNGNTWLKLPFINSKTRGYCDGYVDCKDSMYPSPPLRIMKAEKEIVRETKGRGEVSLGFKKEFVEKKG